MGKTLGNTSRKKKPHGYLVDYGYYGWVNWYHGFMLFATEEEYLEYLKYIDENRQIKERKNNEFINKR